MRKKLDNRIRILIENGVTLGHRSMFIVVGEKGKDQVVILHHILSKATFKARPSVLWCYKKELGFSTHRKKRMRQLQKKMKLSKMELDEDDPFSLFIASTQIRFCYYSETHKILGNTYGMLVLQDFEAFTPNLLARTIETVEGGGAIVILLRTVTSLKQLYTMVMDVHVRFRTESHQDVVGRFNERFILSLSSCKNCLVINDQLDILPIFPSALHIEPAPRKLAESPESKELATLKKSLQDTQPVGVLINCCKTLDQGKVLLKFIDCLSEKNLRGSVALTAARGRGKSAALGLAISAAVAFNYSNIFVTSPSPENLKTLFEFILKGFDALCYQEHLDYELIQSTNPEFKKSVVRVNVFREHRQTIQYIHPSDAKILTQAELVVIDEAAAIPLPLVRNLLGPYLVFMASTVNGYEGTGRSLSLKLIQQLRQQASVTVANKCETTATDNTTANTSTGYILHEVTLNESIRYQNGDPVEAWLNELLCLDATAVKFLSSGCPAPKDCDLYYINRDTLFSYHKASEAFLQRIMALYVASHYKNSPNDLQMMSDAPAHNLFCLLPPVDPNTRKLPEVLCVIQVCLEGEICRSSVVQELSRGKRASGDLIPWTVSQQFQDDDFPSLSGARIVRIATHPEYQRMGYGSHALQLLEEYYSGKFCILEENDTKHKISHEITCVDDETIGSLKDEIAPRKSLPPLLLKLNERPAEKLDYIGVSFGLTADLLKFWKKAGYVPVYLRQTVNDLTGEHSCIMLKILSDEESGKENNWLHAFWTDFRQRFITLLAAAFRDFKSSLAVSMLQNKIDRSALRRDLSKVELEIKLSKHDMKRLEMYSQNLVDYHLITDLLPIVTQFYFQGKLGDTHLSAVQSAILACLGLQMKTIDDASKELDLPSVQVMALFNKAIKRITNYLQSLNEKSVEETFVAPQNVTMEPLAQTLQEEMAEVAKEIKERQQKELKALQDQGLSQYAIKGSEEEWLKELGSGSKTLINIKSIQKRSSDSEKLIDKEGFQKKKKFKNKRKS